ncbi:LCP family protein [Streptomyces sp. NPDC127068]|uniref:LCP family protein n=1 Tax=Streptomyces sp. NPDC127068 TaxID=3347127 RepID=UPI003655BFDD
MRGEESRPRVRRGDAPARSGTDLADEQSGADADAAPALRDPEGGATGESVAALAEDAPRDRGASRRPAGGKRPAGAAGSRPGPAGRGAGRPGGGGRGPGVRPARRKRRILRWAALVLSVVILGTAGAGYLYYRHLNGNIRKGELNIGEHKAPTPTPNAAGQTPLNILLIGSDSRNTKENLRLGGSRESVGAAPLADVQMLVHLSADRSNMSVVSMPRDTLVEIPKCTDPEGETHPASNGRVMTNQSLGRGGAGCTVATWEKLTDIHINHFIQVDFAGVVDMADAIGGVPVCVDKNIYSHTASNKGSGLKLPEGTHSIKGEQALQWLRTRYGFGDGSDIGRAKAQHMYMSSMVRELRKNATLSNPGKLRGLAETATRALTVDKGLDDVMKLYELGNELRKVPPDRITMTTMPFDYLGPRVVPKPGDAEQLFRLIREDISLDGKDKKRKKKAKLSDDPPAPDAQIAVQIVNGTRTDVLAPAAGRASTVAQLLAGKGFDRSVADTQRAVSEAQTVITFPSADLEGDAQRVAKALGIPLSSVEQSTEVSGVTLTVGADWREGSVYPKDGGLDDSAPKSANLLNGADEQTCMEVNPGFTY